MPSCTTCSPGDEGDSCEGRTPANNAPVRTVFVIGPDKRIKLTLAYPMTTGRNFDEIIRVLDSMQLTAKHKVATPANWKQGEDVIITGAVSNDDADKIFPGYKTVKPYLRTTRAAEVVCYNALPPRRQLARRPRSTDGEVANALVCKTSIHGFKSHSVLHKINNLAFGEWGRFSVCGRNCGHLLQICLHVSETQMPYRGFCSLMSLA